MQAPAPAPPYGSTLAPFEGVNPNGTWKLFILDETFVNNGFLPSWSVNLTTEKGADPGEPLVLDLTAKKQKLKRKLTLNVNASEAGWWLRSHAYRPITLRALEHERPTQLTGGGCGSE